MSNLILIHSAKGSEWEDHMYVKKVDGKYYYKDGYENGRTISSLKDKSNGNSGGSSGSDQIVGDGSDLDNMAISVIRGNYGNGETRKQALGDMYRQIQDRVNELLGVIGKKSINSQNTSGTSDLVNKIVSDITTKKK